MEQEKKLGMKWYKFTIWVRLPLSIVTGVLMIPDGLEAIFETSAIIAVLGLIIDLGLLVTRIVCWIDLGNMLSRGYKLMLALIASDVVGALLDIVIVGDSYSFGRLVGMLIFSMLEWIYYRKRRHLFFEDDEGKVGAAAPIDAVSSIAVPVVSAAPAAPVAEKPILTERAAPVAASVVPAPAPTPVPVSAPAPAAETAALAPQADAEAAIEEEAVVPMPAKTESGAEPFKTDFVSPAKPAPCISFCRHCGKKLEEGSVFCNRCGKKVMWDE